MVNAANPRDGKLVPKSANGESVRAGLEALVADSGYERDPAQLELAARFDALADALAAYAGRGRAGGLARLFSQAPLPPRGLYVYGAVGRGKTMLMDLFFAAAPVALKRRVHADAFMADVHQRLHELRLRAKRGEIRDGDPTPAVAGQIAAEARLLCFDEFSVRDIADAMILGRLFKALLAEGVVVVATSNVAPDDLYKDGLNRALFLPFIALLNERLDIVELKARADFRLEKLAKGRVYLTPDDGKAAKALDETFLRLVGQPRGEPTEIQRPGRVLPVAQAVRGVARFSFGDLCRAALAAGDYLAVAERFHTVFIEHIPVFTAAARDEARRFIALIDALYDARVKVLASAAAEPEALGVALEGWEAFEFARAASRLVEMRSQEYLASPHGRPASASLDLGGLVET